MYVCVKVHVHSVSKPAHCLQI